MSFLGSQLPLRGAAGSFRDVQQQPIGPRTQQSQYDQSFGADAIDSPSRIPQHKRLADMNEAERYGLPGLLSMIPLESPDYSALAVGQDLTVLGLDLSRPE